MKKVFFTLHNIFALTAIILFSVALLSQPVLAQSLNSSENQLKSLRSDVGIHGLTANVHWLNDASYLGNDTLSFDGSSELESSPAFLQMVRMLISESAVGEPVL